MIACESCNLTMDQSNQLFYLPHVIDRIENMKMLVEKTPIYVDLEDVRDFCADLLNLLNKKSIPYEPPISF